MRMRKTGRKRDREGDRERESVRERRNEREGAREGGKGYRVRLGELVHEPAVLRLRCLHRLLRAGFGVKVLGFRVEGF